jgi:hypothetical protein
MYIIFRATYVKMYYYTFDVQEKGKCTRTLLVTTKMKLYIFAGRTLYTWLALVTGVYTDDKHGCTQ